MTVVIQALLPVLALISVGYALKKGGFPGESFWRPAARMVYFVFLPALLVHVVALAKLDPSLWKAQIAAIGTVCIITGLLLLSRKLVSEKGPAFTSVMQGSVRHNTYIGLAIAGSIFTADQTANFALLVAVIVPLVNAISVICLGKFGVQAQGNKALSGGEILKLVALNPLIVACALGAILNVSGIGLPYGSEALFKMLGKPALTLGLLVVGAGLQAGALIQVSKEIVVPVLIRLVLYPLLAVSIGKAIGIDPEYIPPLALLASLPTAASAYVLALELGGDKALMARIITVETLAAALSIPLVLYWII